MHYSEKSNLYNTACTTGFNSTSTVICNDRGSLYNFGGQNIFLTLAVQYNSPRNLQKTKTK